MNRTEAQIINEVLADHGRRVRDQIVPLGRVLGPPHSYKSPRHSIYMIELDRGVRPDQIMRLDTTIDDRLTRHRCSATLCRFLMNPFAVVVQRKDPETVYFKDIAPVLTRQPRGVVQLTLGKYIEHSAEAKTICNLNIDLAKPTTPHCLFAGTTGSGKSVNEVAAILSLSITSSPQDVGMILLDGKGMDFPQLMGLPHVMQYDPTNPLLVLRRVIAEMDRRKAECNDDPMLIATAWQRYPHIVIFMDEVGILFENGKSDIAMAMQDILQRGREMGIHFVGGVQKPSKELMGSTNMANLPARSCGLTATASEGYYATGVTSRELGSNRLAGNGDFVLVLNGTKVLPYQSPFVDKKAHEDIRIADSVTRWWNGQKTKIVLPPPNERGVITVKTEGQKVTERQEKHNAVVEALKQRRDIVSIHGVTKLHREMFGAELNFNTAQKLYDRAAREMGSNKKGETRQ